MEKLKLTALLLLAFGLAGCKIGNDKPKEEPQQQVQTEQPAADWNDSNFGMVYTDYIVAYEKLAKLYYNKTGLYPNQQLSIVEINRKAKEVLACNMYQACILGEYTDGGELHKVTIFPSERDVDKRDMSVLSVSHFGLGLSSIMSKKYGVPLDDSFDIVRSLIAKRMLENSPYVETRYHGLKIYYSSGLYAIQVTVADEQDQAIPEFSKAEARRLIKRAEQFVKQTETSGFDTQPKEQRRPEEQHREIEKQNSGQEKEMQTKSDDALFHKPSERDPSFRKKDPSAPTVKL